MTNYIDEPIIDIGHDPDAIKIVPIEECHEKLIEVQTKDKIFIAPQYYTQGIQSAENKIYVRVGVLDALQIASTLLPDGLNLLLWDGLRTLETQNELFDKARIDFEKDKQVEQYLAAPPMSEQDFYTFPPPHTTGGAIDLTLCNDLGQAIDMGAAFDEFRENAWLAYFEEDRIALYGKRAITYRKLRRTLYWVMMKAGFSPYPWEFWHYEIGTTVAANFKGLRCAKYGAAIRWSMPA